MNIELLYGLWCVIWAIIGMAVTSKLYSDIEKNPFEGAAIGFGVGLVGHVIALPLLWYYRLPQKDKSDQMRYYALRSLFWLVVVMIVIYTVFPFFWAISLSFKTNADSLQPATYIPENPTDENYAILDETNVPRSMLNSAFVASTTVILALVVGSFAAYALGRAQFRGRRIMLYLVLAMTMFPQISILSGMFQFVDEVLDIYGSPMSLIFSYPIFVLPFTIWVLTSFFEGLPSEIEQAALVDGANPFQTFYMILLPLTMPALVTTGLLAFIAAWNEYLFALTFTLVNDKGQTVPVAINQFTGGTQYEEPVASLLAAVVVVTIPLIVLVLAFQRRILAGLTAGAVKG